MPLCILYYKKVDLPTEDTKDQVEHKKRSNHYEWDEENPVEHTAKGVIGLQNLRQIQLKHSSLSRPMARA